MNTTASPATSEIAPQNSTPQKTKSAPSKKLTNPNTATHIQPPKGGGEGEGEGGFFGLGGGEDD